MTITPYQRQYNSTLCLNKIFNGNFSLDALDIADAYYPETRMYPFIYRWLKVQRELAITRKSPPQYYAVLRDFKDHLIQRIQTLHLFLPVDKQKILLPLENFNTDLWSERLQREKLNTLESNSHTLELLLAASLHVQDVLFNLETAVGLRQKTQNFESESLEMGAEHSQTVKAAPIPSNDGSKDCAFWTAPIAVSRFNCEEAINCLPTETVMLAKELETFIESALPAYLTLLPQLSEATKTEFLINFTQLKTSLACSELEEVKVQLVLIRNIIAPFPNRTVKAS